MSHFSSFISGPPPSSCVQLRAFFAQLVPQLFRAGKRRIFCPVVFLLLFSLFLLSHFLAKRFLKAATAEGYKKRLRTELGIGGTQRGGERRAVRSLMARGRKFAKHQKKSKKTHSRLMFAIINY